MDRLVVAEFGIVAGVVPVDGLTAESDALCFDVLVLPVHAATTEATPAIPASLNTSRREGCLIMG